MTEVRPETGAHSERPVADAEFDILGSALVVWRHRWLIGVVCLVAVLATFGATVTKPKVYESSAALLVPREGGSTLLGGLANSGLLSQVQGLSLPSLTPTRDMLVSILKSQTVARAVVERFRLQERYRSVYLEDAIRELQGATMISVSREGIISVKVEETDPGLAAEMANFYVEQLDRLVTRYGISEAGLQRRFLTEQLARAKTDLEGAEEALRGFQERNRAIALQEQTREAIEAAARLKGEILAAEVQFHVMRNFATEANPEVVTLRRRIEEMKRRLSQMQYGDAVVDSATPGRDRRDFTVPFPKVPQVGLELARLTRGVKVQETLVMLLTQHLEQAKIAQARDLPIVQVLDRAVPAERHSKPRIRLSVAIAGLTSLFVGILLAFFVEYVRKPARRALVPKHH